MLDLVVLTLIVVGVVAAAVILLLRCYHAAHPAPVPGVHDVLPAPGSAPSSSEEGGDEVSARHLRSFLMGLPRPLRNRRDRKGTQFLIGQESGDYVIIVLKADSAWRYVLTTHHGKPVLWGAKRPREDCQVTNTNTGDLQVMLAAAIQGVLAQLRASYVRPEDNR